MKDYKSDRPPGALTKASIVGIAEVQSKANAVINLRRLWLLSRFTACLLSLALLFGIAARLASAHYAANAAFHLMNRSSGIIRHIYFAVVTLDTLGYGDVYPVNGFGYVYVGVAALTTVYILIIGAGFVISHWYYSVECLKDDLAYEVKRMHDEATARLRNRRRLLTLLCQGGDRLPPGQLAGRHRTRHDHR